MSLFAIDGFLPRASPGFHIQEKHEAQRHLFAHRFRKAKEALHLAPIDEVTRREDAIEQESRDRIRPGFEYLEDERARRPFRLSSNDRFRQHVTEGIAGHGTITTTRAPAPCWYGEGKLDDGLR